MGERTFRKFTAKNEAMFDKAYRIHHDGKPIRKQKREKKRNKLRKRNRALVEADESEEDIPLIRQKRASRPAPATSERDISASQSSYYNFFVDSQDSNPLGPPAATDNTDGGLFVEPSPITRKAPFEQSSTDDDESTPSGGDTDDSMMGELNAEAKRAARKEKMKRGRATEELNLGRSILSPESPRKKAVVPPTESTSKSSGSRTLYQDEASKVHRTVTAPAAPLASRRVETTTKISRPSLPSAQASSSMSRKDSVGNLTGRTVSNAATNLSANTAKPASPVMAKAPARPNNPTAIRKTGNNSKHAIRITNEPKSAPREWQNGTNHFNKLKYRHLADVRSRTEGTPDPTALEFVGQAPAGPILPRAPARVDNPYGRREVGNRRMQEIDADEPSRRDAANGIVALQPFEVDKVPMVCYNWRMSSNCPYSAEKCLFMHRHKDQHGRDLPISESFGYVPPKYRKPPLTCPFWLHVPSGCKKPDADCKYAHRNTGWAPKDQNHKDEAVQIDPTQLPATELLVRQPSSSAIIGSMEKRKMKPHELTCWYWTQGNCVNSPETCSFQHHDTGVIADPPPKAPTPCRFWLQGRCFKTAEQCKYQHFDTAIVSGQPPANFSAFLTLGHMSLADAGADFASSHLRNGVDQNASKPIEGTTHWDELQSPAEQPYVPPLPSLPPPPTVAQPQPALIVPSLPATSSCPQLNEAIEQALKIDFTDLFEWSQDENGHTMSDRRALLLYHPVDHFEELEVITRWLLMHHVEVSSAWHEGCWDYFRQQIAKGGSGVVIVGGIILLKLV